MLSQLLQVIDFSRATVFEHLSRLIGVTSGEPLIEGKKGRSKLSYRLLKPLQNLSTADFVLLFTRLEHACRFEKGIWCKKIKKTCSPQTCLLIEKK